MQTVVITGANRGIGLQLARTFSRSGDEVIAAVRDPEHARSLRELPGGRGIRVLKLDVTDQASVDVFSRTLGGERIDILVNNAGVMERRSELDAMDFAFWSRAMEVNAIGPLRVSAALLANLRQSDHPRIVTLTSRMGSMQVYGGGWFAYRSSKAAANKVMQLLAEEFREHGIVVCPVHPGWVRTEMGGPDGDLSAEQSAAALHKLINELKLEHSCRFWNFDGAEIPW